MAATMQVTFECPGCGSTLSLPLQMATHEQTGEQLVVEMHSTPEAEMAIEAHARRVHASSGRLA